MLGLDEDWRIKLKRKHNNGKEILTFEMCLFVNTKVTFVKWVSQRTVE